EDSHSEGSHGMGEEMPGANLPQEERERRMGIFHYNEGNKFFNNKNYNEAIIRYQKALQHHKGFKEAIINLSSAYMKNKEFDKALETLKAGQKQFPKAALIDFNLACYYSLTQNLESGLSALKTAVDKGYKQFKQIENDPDLQNLRNSALYQEWKAKIPGGI
ncbi:MAG: tetratricopeptide repeat protein, partial [Nitrospinaceae bacterium]|nr:tetratricopeptide repeat protein [Nitrospinaceae bacterium]